MRDIVSLLKEVGHGCDMLQPLISPADAWSAPRAPLPSCRCLAEASAGPVSLTELCVVAVFSFCLPRLHRGKYEACPWIPRVVVVSLGMLRIVSPSKVSHRYDVPA